MMKKIISLLLIAMICLSFVVCGSRIYLIDSSLTKTAPQAWKTPAGRVYFNQNQKLFRLRFAWFQCWSGRSN